MAAWISQSSQLFGCLASHYNTTSESGPLHRHPYFQSILPHLIPPTFFLFLGGAGKTAYFPHSFMEFLMDLAPNCPYRKRLQEIENVEDL